MLTATEQILGQQAVEVRILRRELTRRANDSHSPSAIPSPRGAGR